jgi:hypothetical protein
MLFKHRRGGGERGKRFTVTTTQKHFQPKLQLICNEIFIQVSSTEKVFHFIHAILS